MRPQGPLTAILIILSAALASGQDPAVQDTLKTPEPLFVRLTVYPTASLSRYDYNNDIDLYEVRIYAEIRRGSQEGAPVADAAVTALAERLDFLKDHYERRIELDRTKLPPEIGVEIAVKGRPALKERFPLPAWLVLTAPQPAILDPGRDLAVRWQFDRFPSPVDVRAYDFRTGLEFYHADHLEQTAATIPAAGLPASTIVRIYIIQSWLYKRYLAGDAYARGSEINIIPWSQVFVRTAAPAPGGSR